MNDERASQLIAVLRDLVEVQRHIAGLDVAAEPEPEEDGSS